MALEICWVNEFFLQSDRATCQYFRTLAFVIGERFWKPTVLEKVVTEDQQSCVKCTHFVGKCFSSWLPSWKIHFPSAIPQLRSLSRKESKETLVQGPGPGGPGGLVWGRLWGKLISPWPPSLCSLDMFVLAKHHCTAEARESPISEVPPVSPRFLIRPSRLLLGIEAMSVKIETS